jgi:hypothetical protein
MQSSASIQDEREERKAPDGTMKERKIDAWRKKIERLTWMIGNSHIYLYRRLILSEDKCVSTTPAETDSSDLAAVQVRVR